METEKIGEIGIVSGTKAKKLLTVCQEPKRFTEIWREIGMSKAWLAEALKKLQEAGLVEKLPDGRYVLTEEGKRLAAELREEAEVEELLSEAVKRGYVVAVKEELENIFDTLFAAEAVIRVLRAWAMVAAVWRWISGGGVKAEAEEKRAVAALENVLRQLGGETWWRRYAVFLPSWVVERMNELYEKRAFPVFALAYPTERVATKALELLKDIPPRGVEVLTKKFGEEVRYQLLLLVHLTEERARELTETPLSRKLGKALLAMGSAFFDGIPEFFEKELENFLA